MKLFKFSKTNWFSLTAIFGVWETAWLQCNKLFRFVTCYSMKNKREKKNLPKVLQLLQMTFLYFFFCFFFQRRNNISKWNNGWRKSWMGLPSSTAGCWNKHQRNSSTLVMRCVTFSSKQKRNQAAVQRCRYWPTTEDRWKSPACLLSFIRTCLGCSWMYLPLIVLIISPAILHSPDINTLPLTHRRAHTHTHVHTRVHTCTPQSLLLGRESLSGIIWKQFWGSPITSVLVPSGH